MARIPEYKVKNPDESSLKRLVNTIAPGSEFGDWTTGLKAAKKDYIQCTCKCGTKRDVHVYSLRSGKSVSCGCRRQHKEEKDA